MLITKVIWEGEKEEKINVIYRQKVVSEVFT